MTSLRRRILLPLVPAIGIALLAAGLGLESSVRRDLMDSLEHNVLVLARVVGAAVDIELDGESSLELEGTQVLAFGGAGDGAFYRVADDTGEIVFLSAAAPAPPPLRSEMGPLCADHRENDVRYRVCTLPVMRAPEADAEDRADWLKKHPGEPLPALEPRRFWVTMGLPTATVDAALTALRTRLLLGLGTLFLVLLVLPTWIVSRALRPLRKLSQQADHLGPEDPSRRLGEAGVDQEVFALASALNRALDRLSEAYARQQRFTADAAHELRTPLTALRTNCEVTLRRERSADELRETLESVYRTVLRMVDLVQDLLALSRLQQESMPGDSTCVELTTIVREAVSLHTKSAKAGDVRLELELDPPVTVCGNAGLLTECVSNLVENAVRHTPAGGRVSVSVCGDEPKVVVRDTGSGIDEEHLGKIFERFYRVDTGRSRGTGGAGLGLALAAEIARVHGGKITAMSQPGEGSCFTLHLPAMATDPAPSTPNEKEPPNPRDGSG